MYWNGCVGGIRWQYSEAVQRVRHIAKAPKARRVAVETGYERKGLNRNTFLNVLFLLFECERDGTIGDGSIALWLLADAIFLGKENETWEREPIEIICFVLIVC